MRKPIFITATDTGAGKTYTTAGLLHIARARQLKTIGLKPVASGCSVINGELRNSDALQLQQAASTHLAYDIVNPFAFAPAIAPHIVDNSATLSVSSLIKRTLPALSMYADLYFIEGFGGWHAPLNADETMADYAVKLPCDVLIVVGIRFGCINHAILTERAVLASGASCIGWIANLIDPGMSHPHENIATLQHWLHTPLLGVIRHNQPVQEALHDHTIF